MGVTVSVGAYERPGQGKSWKLVGDMRTRQMGILTEEDWNDRDKRKAGSW